MAKTLVPGLLACLLLAATAMSQEGGGEQPPAPAPPAAPAAPQVRITAELSDGAKILGHPIALDALPIKTDFGSVAVPLKLLASIEMGKDGSTVQCRFRNNDVLTVKLEIDTLKLRTSYGEATIPFGRVRKLLLADAK